MRNHPIAFVLGCAVSVLMAAAPIPANAQVKKDAAKSSPPPSNGPEVRYFTSLGDILGDLPVDSFIKETRQGGKVTAATLDVCYPLSATSDRKDRFVIDLKVDGQKLSGSGESFEARTPVTVSLTRKLVDKAITFDGKITVGSTASLVSSTDNGEITEQEFQRTQTADDDISEKPEDFTQVSPQSIAARIKRENFVELVKGLKAQNVVIGLDSLTVDCNSLRSGQQVLHVTVDPARAAALIATLKSSPGTTAAGWTSGTYDIDRAVRLFAAEWRDGDRLNRDKIATAISGALAKALSAKTMTTQWNDKTGEVMLVLKRPSQLAPTLELTETLQISALVSPEKPADFTRLIVWFGIPTSKTTDESAGAHLEFTANPGNDEESAFGEDDTLIKAMAADLKGQRWDAGKSAWK